MILALLVSIFLWQKYHNTHRLAHILLAMFFLCLAPYFYSTAKLFIPLMGILFIIIWPPKIKHLLLTIFFGLVVLSPMVLDTINGHSGYRFSYISIFTQPHREQVTDTLRYQDILLDHPGEIGVKTPIISYIIHNKYQLVLQKFISNYLLSFSPDFLFLKGDNNVRQGFGGHGLLYVLDFFLILPGLYLCLHQKTKLGKLFFWLLILSPLPFALTRDSDTPHATRLILMLPSLIYFISLSLQKKLYLIPLYLILFFNFWHYYQNHYPQDSARSWHSNLKETVQLTATYPQSKIYFSNKAEPFLPFFLYYFPYLPADSLTNHLTRSDTDYFQGECLDEKYCFGQINSAIFPLS